MSLTSAVVVVAVVVVVAWFFICLFVGDGVVVAAAGGSGAAIVAAGSTNVKTLQHTGFDTRVSYKHEQAHIFIFCGVDNDLQTQSANAIDKTSPSRKSHGVNKRPAMLNLPLDLRSSLFGTM